MEEKQIFKKLIIIKKKNCSKFLHNSIQYQMLVENNMQCFDVDSDPVIFHLLKMFFKMADNILKYLIIQHIKYP